MRTIQTPVLVVGAGPAGLVTSLTLAHHGVESLLVEKHPGTSIYPRATAVSTRTMEIFRGLGVEDGRAGVGVDVDGPHAHLPHPDRTHRPGRAARLPDRRRGRRR